ncbi:B12 binding domain protein [Stieleria neptunia]|uniref:B12 binding domain protein n=1 Tax=Stieleria neptunia TaxID=2527979 RepID=A0A518HHU5_9BACT|nr:cobalamin-dependent protein [Stieleria neptunia]QDV40421.1 B12 binding domain protein [Stieleria neptunia]
MKIGLIAMSGIRCCDEELLRKGLTLPGFVERSETIASLPSLGLLTLAGMIPDQDSVEYFEVQDLKQLDPLPENLDLVAISSFSAQIPEAYTLADQFRARGIPVVLGGLHVTSLPDEALRHGDAVVIGEGEVVWRDLLDDARAGKLRRRYSSFDVAEFDLADAPMPAYELLDITKYNRLTVQTSRGCPRRCEFCASSILLTRRYKQKPIPKVLAELDRICELWPRPFIEFADDNSFIHRAYWKELLPQLKQRRVKWFAETDLSVHEDEGLLRMMRDSGCAEVLIGLESPILPGLKGIELKNDWKRRQWPHYIEAVERIQGNGIRVNGCFILGLDGQGTDIFDAVYDFAEQAKLYDVQITYQTPFPGTPLYARLEKDNRLLYPGAWERCTLFDLNYQPTPMSADELQQGFHELAERLYCEDFTQWRRKQFAKHYLYSRRHKRDDPLPVS